MRLLLYHCNYEYVSGGILDKTLEEKLLELAQTYLTDMKKLTPVLEESLKLGQYDEIEKHAHRVKGNAGSYGFFDLGEIGKEMETNAKEANAERITELIKEFDACLDKNKG